MTHTPSEQRLDRIERILDTLASNQITEREDRLAMREDLEILYQRVRQSAEQMAVNTTAISQLREELHSKIAEGVGMIGILAHSVEENGAYIRALAEQAERDRNQAAIDRESFQTSIRDILAHLQTRYNGNEGHQTE